MDTDGAEGVMLDMSLDSVVQKASELTEILRGCRERVNEGGGRGTYTEDKWSQLETPDRTVEHLQMEKNCTSDGTNPPFPSDGTNPPFPSDGTNPPFPSDETPDHLLPNENGAAVTAMAWQNLTSYIVGLEKQLQYYQSLVEDLQHTTAVSQQQERPTGDTHMQGVRETHEVESPYIGALFHQSCTGKLAAEDKSQEGSEKWDKLMEDAECRVLFLVFSYLTTVELCGVSRVSRKWYMVSSHPLLWTTVNISETVLPNQVLHNLSQRCTQTERLILHGLIPEMAVCDEDLQSYIQRMRGCLEAGFSSVLSVCGHSLLSLTMTECNIMITERALWLAGLHCPRLQEFSYSSDEFPPTSEALWSLAKGCQHLRHLSLPPITGSLQADRFTDTCLLTVSSGWPHLLSLCVGGKTISHKGIANIALYCPHLKHLELLHGPHMNNSAMSEICQDGTLQSLQTLTLLFTPVSPKAVRRIIEHCPLLSSLVLHVSLTTYYPEGDGNTTNIAKFERMLINFRELAKHPISRGVIQLYEHYPQQ